MDSPLSEADSLSSIGASTEPLPASEMGDSSDLDLDDADASAAAMALASPPRRGSAQAAKKAAGSGAESDSSLTEVSDSGEEEEEEEEVESVRNIATSADEEEEDDEDEQPTPRAPLSKKGKKRARPAVEDDEEEDESEDGRSMRSVSLAAGVDARPRAGGDENDDDDEQQEDDAILALAAGAALKKVASYNAADALPAPSGDDDDEGEALSSYSYSDDEPPQKRMRKEVDGAGEDSLSELDEEENSDSALAKGKVPPRGGKAAAAAKGKGKPRPRASSPSDTDDTAFDSNSRPVPDASASASAELDLDAEPATGEESVEEPLAAAVAAAAAAAAVTGKAARGKGARGRGARGRGKGRGAAAVVASGMSRSTSAESSTTTDAFPSSSTLAPPAGAIKPFGNVPLSTSASASQTPLPSGLPAPSGLVELDTTSGAEHLADQLVGLANGTSSAAGGAGEGEAMEGVELTGAAASAAEETPLPEQEQEADLERQGEDLDLDLDPEPEATPQPSAAAAASKRAPPSAKKAAGGKGKKGGKGGGAGGGKGKEKAAAVADVEWTPAGLVPEKEVEEGEGSDAEEGDTSDAAFIRKRAEAMEALTKIEIQFAQLRDVLYVERMEEVEKERTGIESGTHPELLHLTQLIELRRDNKLQLAKRWLDGLEQSYQLQFDHSEHALWNRWQDERARLRTRMLDDANGKRRRLEREKRMLERPKDDSLAHLLVPRPPPAVPLHYRRRLGFDGEPLVDHEITWALRHPDVRADAGVKGLEDEMAYSDLEQMGLREPIRHPIYPYDPVYAHPPGLAPSAFADPRAAAAGHGYPASSYDPSALALQQQQLHHASSFPTLGALPPLPGRADQSSLSRAPSIPNLRPGTASAFSTQSPVDATFAHVQQAPYLAAPIPRTAFSNGSHYPYDAPGEERLHGPAAWAKASQAQAAAAASVQHPIHPAYGAAAVAQEEEQRRRTMSAGGALGDPLGGQNGLVAGPGGAAALAADQNGGRKTPVGGSAKGRFTLDDHMSHRSPKAATPAPSAASQAAQPATSTSGSGRNSPAAFMSIPAIPPFDRHRHEQRLLAQQQSSPQPQAAPTLSAPVAVAALPAPTAQPPVLNPLAKSAQSLFGGQTPAATGQADGGAQQQFAPAAAYQAAAAQRAA
ncbi:hypothetical protein JCM6882_002269 [Rhodosporidiobolus microsporus]